jgi:hypothetical protein
MSLYYAKFECLIKRKNFWHSQKELLKSNYYKELVCFYNDYFDVSKFG